MRKYKCKCKWCGFEYLSEEKEEYCDAECAKSEQDFQRLILRLAKSLNKIIAKVSGKQLELDEEQQRKILLEFLKKPLKENFDELAYDMEAKELW